MSLPLIPAIRRFPEALRRAWFGFWENDGGVYASSIAFHSLASVFAIVFLLSTILNLLGGDVAFLDRLIRYLSDLIPPQALELVHSAGETVTRRVPGALLPVAMVVTVWMGTNVFQAIIHSLNRSYHVTEGRAFWRTRLFALGYMSAGFLLLMVAFSLLTVGGAVEALLPEWAEARTGLLDSLVRVRKILSLGIIALGTFLIYWLAPKFRGEPRIAFPGTLVFTVSWTVSTALFNVYLQNFAVYDKVYGPIATVVVSLTWVNLSSYLLLYGGEVNAAYHRMLQESRKASGSLSPAPAGE